MSKQCYHLHLVLFSPVHLIYCETNCVRVIIIVTVYIKMRQKSEIVEVCILAEYIKGVFENRIKKTGGNWKIQRFLDYLK